MSIESSLDSSDVDTFLDPGNWALNTTLWHEHSITRDETSDCRSETQQKITSLLFPQNVFSIAFQQITRLAWVGEQENQILLTRNIQSKGSDKSELPKHFKMARTEESSCQLGGINGINTSSSEANEHASYLKSFVYNQDIDWVYNRTHGPVIDSFEVLLMNYLGYSPNTANLLRENWIAFHENHKDNPQAKYLQFCHSQGAIHVRNTLLYAPEELRRRIIVIAIAPAVIVSKKLCYKSFNYASKKDIVQIGELAFASGLDTNEFRTSKVLEMVLENHEELILLNPHSSATGIDHDFQSPTFKEEIKKHITDYINHKGEYQ